jgi:predicted alpha/beta-fold hydrolase
MTDLQIIIGLEQIEERVKSLSVQNRALAKQLKEMVKERDEALEINKKLQKEHRQLQKNRTNQANNFLDSQIFAKIVENKLSTEQVSELKGTIDSYIKEIDRCIAQLSE